MGKEECLKGNEESKERGFFINLRLGVLVASREATRLPGKSLWASMWVLGRTQGSQPCPIWASMHSHGCSHGLQPCPKFLRVSHTRIAYK